MRLPRHLAFAAPALMPLLMGAAEADRSTVLELHGPDGSVLADRTVVLECPGSTVELVSDAVGRVELDPELNRLGCLARVEIDEDEVYGAWLSTTPGQIETITLRRSPTSSATAAGRTVSMEELRSIPIGSSTSRDFTAVVESSATATRDAAGIELSGATGSKAWGKGPSVGRLTAGAVDDVKSAASLPEFLDAVASPHPVAERFERPRHIVRVLDRQGRPVAGAHVSIGSRTLRTRRDGRVVLVPGWDELRAHHRLIVRAHGAETTVPLRSGTEQRVVLPRGPAKSLAARVDLALVLDTTGSMGDELSYLQDELGALLSRLDGQHRDLDIRWSLVVYRDEGDEYVARTYDFTSDFRDFSDALAAQIANGGGDHPEAVHTAFQHAQQLSWRDASIATRVLLHVADAPPHGERVEEALRAADGLRAAGTAIYPVAASGVDPVAELSMRAMAMFSGGQYVFLTDDSGVGESHREATASCFRVEPLIGVLGRILDAEIEGRRPVLPQGDRGDGCKEGKRSRPLARRSAPPPPSRPRHHLERSLFDDDAASDFLHLPRVITRR